MKYVYLDYNVYIETLDNIDLKNELSALSDEAFIFLYSPAHIEEVYKVNASENSKYKDKMPMLMENIKMITKNNEVLPSEKGLVLWKEEPRKCYRRVSEIDTTHRVESDSKYRYEKDTEYYRKLREADRQNTSITNIEFDKIWEHPLINGVIDELNSNMSEIVHSFNSSLEVQFLSLTGINKKLSDDLKFEKNSFTKLKNRHSDLEYIIEILFRILNMHGYSAEKSERTSISGTHDVSHAIYATKANYFITTDKRFYKKCKAIYWYLGVNTEIKYCEQAELQKLIRDLSEL